MDLIKLFAKILGLGTVIEVKVSVLLSILAIFERYPALILNRMPKSDPIYMAKICVGVNRHLAVKKCKMKL